MVISLIIFLRTLQINYFYDKYNESCTFCHGSRNRFSKLKFHTVNIEILLTIIYSSQYLGKLKVSATNSDRNIDK